MHDLQLREKISFLAVGGSAALGYLVFGLALTWAGVDPVAASITAYLLCIPPAYLGQRRITFRSARPHTVAFSRYVATQAFGLLVATATVAIASSLGAPPLLAFAVADVIASIQSYLLQKRWVH